MPRFFKIVLVLLFGCLCLDSVSQSVPIRVLVFSKTEGGYRHTSIAAGKTMFLKMANEKYFKVDTTEDAFYFNDSRLLNYDVIVFLSTRGDVLDSIQQTAFQRFIRNGGGFIGIHAATTTEYNWPWYNKLIGAYFDGHPEPQPAFYKRIDTAFYVAKNFPDTLTWTDEVYNFRSVNDSLHYAIVVDEGSYKGGKMGSLHPVSWYHEFEGGRVFYIGLGHFDDAYSNKLFIDIIMRALEWTARVKN